MQLHHAQALRAAMAAQAAPVPAPAPAPPAALPGFVGAYSPEDRQARLQRFFAKRLGRKWKKTVKYGVRKDFADQRMRVRGRFVRKEDEAQLRDVVQMI